MDKVIMLHIRVHFLGLGTFNGCWRFEAGYMKQDLYKGFVEQNNQQRAALETCTDVGFMSQLPLYLRARIRFNCSSSPLTLEVHQTALPLWLKDMLPDFLFLLHSVTGFSLFLFKSRVKHKAELLSSS